MSTYDPGKVYLIDMDGAVTPARYNPTADMFLLFGGVVRPVADIAHNVRPAIVLDPEDADVRGFLGLNEMSWDHSTVGLAKQIRAQITPPEPPMEEPQYVGALVQTRWSTPGRDPEVWARQVDGYWTALTDPDTSSYSWPSLLEMDPRPYENPRQEPATAPQSDAQGSVGGIGRVSDSDAVEAARAHAEACVERGLRALARTTARKAAAAQAKENRP